MITGLGYDIQETKRRDLDETEEFNDSWTVVQYPGSKTVETGWAQDGTAAISYVSTLVFSETSRVSNGALYFHIGTNVKEQNECVGYRPSMEQGGMVIPPGPPVRNFDCGGQTLP